MVCLYLLKGLLIPNQRYSEETALLFHELSVRLKVFNLTRLKATVEVMFESIRSHDLRIHLAFDNGIVPVDADILLLRLSLLKQLLEVLLACTLPLASVPLSLDQ